MNFDLDLLKKLNKRAFKWSMTAYVVLSSILVYKIYRNTSDFCNLLWDDISYKIQSLFYSTREILDSLDGWVVFWTLVGTFAVSLMVCSFLQRKITEQGRSLIDDDEL